MADTFFGNVIEFIVGYVVFEIVNGLGGLLLIFIVPLITGAITQEQLISQLIVANYLMHGIAAILLLWWRKVLGAGYALFALLHFLFRVNVIIFLLSLF